MKLSKIELPNRRSLTMARLIALLILSCFVPPVIAEEALPKTAEKFEINTHTAYLYPALKPAKGNPWVWYAPTLKGLSLAQRKMYYEGFLRAGITLAGFDLGEVRGSPASTAQFTLFYDEMIKRNYSPKPILLGQSRGGLMMLAWATRHPDKTQAFVGIYPVCNLADWPMKNKPTLLADYNLTEPELLARLKEFNPIDNLQGLLSNKVPIFIVHGDADKLVPYDQNSRLLKDRYESAGGSITVKLIPNEGHQVSPSFFECRELLEFVLEQSSATAPKP
jgi:predicted esterase